VARFRFIIFLITLIVVITAGTVAALYARGYRFDSSNGELTPNGLLVLKSAPDGAQIFIDGELKTATNANIHLPPGTYDISVRKEGYISWNKRLTIKKEEVTETTAHLFKSAPSLSAVTFSESINPTPSWDFTRIAYIVPSEVNGNIDSENAGLWVMEMLNLPLGFSRDPRRITDGDLSGSTFQWSPDSSQIMLTKSSGAIYLLDTSSFTPQKELVNVAGTEDEVLAGWQEDETKKLDAQINKLPDEMQDVLNRKSRAVVFSPDEDMVLYTASGSATIEADLIPQLPGSSTQKQERNVETDQTYIYDIKEDRNFLVDDSSADLVIEGGVMAENVRRMSWYTTSRHVILAEPDKITIMDYDGTNRQTVYTGSYISPNAFPTLSLDRLIILTNLGSTSTPANLYSLGIK
jgi:hypothetical protein